ncbi:MAG TPA: hypothetical protein VLL48_11610, partial [Longimicrobiales bacterium]|nr:hypothetical protein [Longimicrobiales bacterium]
MLAGAVGTLAAFGGGGGPGLGAQEVIELPEVPDVEALLVVPAFAVGAADGEPWEVFGSVDAVGFGPGGDVYVLDGQGYRVVVLDDDGAHVRTFGRQGGGPGEFQMPRALTVLGDGRVVVLDDARRSYQVLSGDGVLERSVATDVMRLGARAWGELRAHPAQGFLSVYRGMDIDTGDPETSRENGDVIPVLHYRLDGTGEPVELFRADFPGDPATMVLRPGEQRVEMGPPPAFSPPFAWGVLPDGGAVYTDGTGFALHVVAPDGRRLRTLRRDLEPRPVTERDREDERDRRLEALESTGAGAPVTVTEENGVRTVRRDIEMGRRMLERLRFAEVMPVLEDLAVDREGRIWVQRRGDRVGERGPVEVVTPE